MKKTAETKNNDQQHTFGLSGGTGDVFVVVDFKMKLSCSPFTEHNPSAVDLDGSRQNKALRRWTKEGSK
jgi:hypothetical protein